MDKELPANNYDTEKFDLIIEEIQNSRMGSRSSIHHTTNYMNGIIIGGGIGGLTAAIALRQRGILVTVYEAAPELKSVGAGIIMATNAMIILQRLGLAEKIQSNGYELNDVQIADANWRTIQKINSHYAQKKYGLGSYAIHRAALQQILYEELPEDVVLMNHRVEHVSQTEDKVHVKFTNGNEAEADFLIGADGIKSVVRQFLFGNTKYRYSGQTCWRATVDTTIPKRVEKSSHELWGSKAGLRLGIVPLNPNQLYIYATVCSTAGGKDDLTTIRKNLIQQFSEFGNYSTQLLEATDLHKIIRTDIYDFAPIKKWYKGRIALIGDAAHATTPNLGQGGCQAIEDGYVIAQSLARHQQPDKAFETFQSIRYAKAKYVVNTSWWLGQLTNLSSPLLINIRNAAIRLIPSFANKKIADKLYQLNY